MDVAVDDDVDHGRDGGIVFDCDGADHALILGIVSYAVFIDVYAGHVEGDGAHAAREEEEAIARRQVKRHRVVEGIAGIAGLAVDAVPSTVVDEGHAFPDFDGQVGGMEFIVVDGDVVVAIALSIGHQRR